jgi:hypothetical protein
VVDPPSLPRRLSDMPTVVGIGSTLWLFGAAVLLVAWLVAGRPLDVWFATCVAGGGLGAVGYGIFRWQRSAVRRGARGAQQGLD